MGDNNFAHEMRRSERRKVADRRQTVRFSDMSGRRLGVERRLPKKDTISIEVSH